MAIKIDFEGFSDTGIDNYLVSILRKRFDIVVDKNNPNYIFYSCFHPNYEREGVKIFFTGENARVNFNHFDYGIGFDYISFEDRYFRWPLYRAYGTLFSEISGEVKQKKAIENILNEKQKFCSFIYSNSKLADPIRELFFKRLSEYKKVDSGGKAFNNIGGPVHNKLEFIENYKFNIAFENSSTPGYTTEKLIEAMSVNTIPIYWGNPVIDREFNTESFFWIQSKKDIDPVIERIIKCDQSDELYSEMLAQPWVKPNSDCHNTEGDLLDFFQHIFEQPYDEAFRIQKYGFETHSLDPLFVQKELRKKRWKALKRKYLMTKYPSKLLKHLKNTLRNKKNLT